MPVNFKLKMYVLLIRIILQNEKKSLKVIILLDTDMISNL